MQTADSQVQPHDNPLGYAPVEKLIAMYAIPAILSMLVTAAYNITDQIFIGNVVGMHGNEATNIVFPTVTLTIAFAQMAGIGTAANFNIYMGKNEKEEAKRYIGTGITFMGILGILIMMIVFIFKRQILLICGATEASMPLAMSYLTITNIGLPFFLFSNGGCHMIRADGSPMYSMLCNVSGALLNVFLDALFMYGFGWGIQGAALATVTGQIFSFILCVAYFPRMKSFRFSIQMLGIRAPYLIQIMKLGLSNFINQIIMMIVNITLNNMLKTYGAVSVYGEDIPLAVSGVVAKLNTIVTSFSVGLAQGCQPIWGFNLGAKKYGRVKETYKKALAAALSVGFVVFAAFQLFPTQIVSIFGSGEALYYEFAAKYMRIYLMLVFAQTIQPLSVNYFTGIGNMRQGVLISLSRQGFLLLPMLIIFPWIFGGINGILYAGPTSDAIAGVLAISMVIYNFKHLEQRNT